MKYDSSPTTHAPISWRAIVSFTLAALFLFYEMGIQVSPGVMASSMMSDLHFSAPLFGLVMSAYYYSYSAMMIPAGLLYDRFSTKYILLIAVCLCALGCFLFAHAGHALALILARFFTGFGSAFAFIGVLVIAGRCFPKKYYAFLVGLTQLFAAFGAMSGETPIAYASAHFGWRATMLGLVGIGFILALCLLFFLKKSCHDASTHCPDELSTDYLKKKHSLKQSLQTIFSKRQTYYLALYSFCVWAPVTFFASLWGVPYLMSRFHLLNTEASFAMEALWLGIAIAAPVLGSTVMWLGHRSFLVSTALLGLLASLALLYLPQLSFSVVCLLSFVIGIAAAANILCFDLVQILHPKTEQAAGVGVNNIAVVIGGAIMQPAVGFLLHWHASRAHAMPHELSTVMANYHVADYLAGLWLMPVCFAVALLTSLFAISVVHVKS